MTPLPYWRYPRPIAPMPAPYPWKRVGFAVVFTALCFGIGAVVVAL